MRTSVLILASLSLATAVVVAPPRLIRRDPLTLADTSKTITFTVWGMPFEDRLFLDGYAKGFEKAEPGVRVDYQRHAGNELNMKYTTSHAAGRGAEVMRIQIVDYHQMVARRMLEPLDAFIRDPEHGLSPERLADFPPYLIEALTIDGKLYALPEDNAAFGLYYNKDLFDAYNAANPSDRVEYPHAGWTWDDLRGTARKLTKRDSSGRIEIHGLDMVIWQWPFMSFFAQAGGRQWNEDGTRTLISERAADGGKGPGVIALEFLHALVYEDRSWSPSFGRNEGTGPDARFAAGHSAMYLDGSWMAANFENRNPSLRFAVAPVPRGRIPAVLTGSCLWGIASHAANKEAGWRMIRWLTAPEQAARYWDALRVAPPASLSVVRSPAFRATAGISRAGRTGEFEVPPMPESLFADRAAWLLYGYEPDAATGRAPGFVPTGLHQRLLEDEIGRMLQEFLGSPGASPQAALDQAAAAVNAVAAKARTR